MNLLSERLLWAMAEEAKRRDGKPIRKVELARAAQTSPTSVGFWLTDVNGIAAPKARLLAEYLHVDPLWLETGEGSPTAQLPAVGAEEVELDEAPPILRKPRLIPVVGRAQAGSDGLLHIDDFNMEHPEGYLLWYANCNEAYALRIRGESMSPRYLPGEFAGVDPCADVLPSDEVIVWLKDGRLMIKRLLWIRDDQACFESVNKDHPNIVIDCDDIDKMHLVTGHIQKSAFRPNI
jgi:phage repressor protein C with HTH and peptisase S24 domain